ncbi:MAG TPA: DUF2934 domain-containing protein [Candidatus Solibacter sp.]|jgi:hypothetical protein
MRKERTKSPTSQDSGLVGTIDAINKDAIEKLAYEYWLNRGCPLGSAEEDWIEAERTLQAAASAAQPATASLGVDPRRFGTAMKAAG